MLSESESDESGSEYETADERDDSGFCYDVLVDYGFFLHVSEDGTHWFLPMYYRAESDLTPEGVIPSETTTMKLIDKKNPTNAVRSHTPKQIEHFGTTRSTSAKTEHLVRAKSEHLVRAKSEHLVRAKSEHLVHSRHSTRS